MSSTQATKRPTTAIVFGRDANGCETKPEMQLSVLCDRDTLGYSVGYYKEVINGKDAQGNPTVTAYSAIPWAGEYRNLGDENFYVKQIEGDPSRKALCLHTPGQIRLTYGLTDAQETALASGCQSASPLIDPLSAPTVDVGGDGYKHMSRQCREPQKLGARGWSYLRGGGSTYHNNIHSRSDDQDEIGPDQDQVQRAALLQSCFTGDLEAGAIAHGPALENLAEFTKEVENHFTNRPTAPIETLQSELATILSEAVLGLHDMNQEDNKDCFARYQALSQGAFVSDANGTNLRDDWLERLAEAGERKHPPRKAAPTTCFDHKRLGPGWTVLTAEVDGFQVRPLPSYERTNNSGPVGTTATELQPSFRPLPQQSAWSANTACTVD